MLWYVNPQQNVKLWYVDVELVATGGVVTQGSKPT
jgi:hypothetical protein